MRMWMVNPAIMCNQHLLGEHFELHKLAGYLETGKSVAGWIKNNCLQVMSIIDRHRAVSREMVSRGIKHNSPITSFSVRDIPMDHLFKEVDVNASKDDLLARCVACRGRHSL